jgi:hypothetical protein
MTSRTTQVRLRTNALRKPPHVLDDGARRQHLSRRTGMTTSRTVKGRRLRVVAKPTRAGTLQTKKTGTWALEIMRRTRRSRPVRDAVRSLPYLRTSPRRRPCLHSRPRSLSTTRSHFREAPQRLSSLCHLWQVIRTLPRHTSLFGQPALAAAASRRFRLAHPSTTHASDAGCGRSLGHRDSKRAYTSWRTALSLRLRLRRRRNGRCRRQPRLSCHPSRLSSRRRQVPDEAASCRASGPWGRSGAPRGGSVPALGRPSCPRRRRARSRRRMLLPLRLAMPGTRPRGQRPWRWAARHPAGAGGFFVPVAALAQGRRRHRQMSAPCTTRRRSTRPILPRPRRSATRRAWTGCSRSSGLTSTRRPGGSRRSARRCLRR